MRRTAHIHKTDGCLKPGLHGRLLRACALAGLVLLPCCTWIHYMGYPQVEFHKQTASASSQRIHLSEGVGRDGTPALRMTTQAASLQGAGGRVRLWTQCLAGELQVLLVSEKPLLDGERCRPMTVTAWLPSRSRRARQSGQSLQPRVLTTRACATQYSPSCLMLERPVAVLEHMKEAVSVDIVLEGARSDEASQEASREASRGPAQGPAQGSAQAREPVLRAVFAPALDRNFLDALTEHCPYDWQLERNPSPFATDAEHQDGHDGYGQGGYGQDAALPGSTARMSVGTDSRASASRASSASSASSGDRVRRSEAASASQRASKADLEQQKARTDAHAEALAHEFEELTKAATDL